MLCVLRLFCWSALAFFLVVLPGTAQSQTFTGEKISFTSLALQKKLTEWEVYSLDASQLHEAAKNAITNPAPITLELETHTWKLNLSPSNLLAPGYKLQVSTPQGLQISSPTEDIAFKGYDLLGGGKTRLSLDDDFIYGFVEKNGITWYIEPLWYLDHAAPHGLYIVYPNTAVIWDQTATCAAMETEQEMMHLQEENIQQTPDVASPDFMACYEVELAIASDHLMFNFYGSVSGVQDHNIGVINNVQDNYVGWFIHDLNFVIVTQFVATSAADDPFTTSTNAGTVLDNFTAWGNAGNFGVSFDVGEMWTDRDFAGTTIGIAWVGGVCNSNKYHCLQNYDPTDAEIQRCLTAHEMGHNFNCQHDGSGCPTWIMCPSVSTASQWSATSIAAVNAYLPSKIGGGCLSPCGPPPPPLVADFDWSPDPACKNQPVSFNNLSSGGITGYAWTFQNGSPPTSTQQNPTVTWSNSGTYNVKLTVQGTGGPVSITKQVVIKGAPTASFTYVVSGTTVTFTNTSTNANSFDWDFGDGSNSTDQDPVHTYDIGGFYTVVLVATNECGSTTKTTIINTAPTAAFSADPLNGCAPLVVHYMNESTPNAAGFSWQFPGGVPSTSGLENPVVTYNFSGTYSATLTASNSSGSNTITKTNYITVQNIPSSSFTHTENGLTATFTNTSVGATSYSWTFGDGGTSTLANPVHTYATAGTYTVVLSAINACGQVNNTQTVTVSAPPVASFTATPTSGCGPLTVQFTSTSSGGPTSYNWQFPGGNPTSSTEQNPSVVYSNPGTYSVTLTVSNASGTNTATQANFITVNAAPSVSTPSNQTACGGATVAVPFNGTAGATFAWTNSNTAIGLAASGSGDISFTSANVTSTQTGTITVTPSLSGCTGTPVSFTITVKPTPTVADPADQTACGGTAVTVNFNGTPSGGTFAWTNSNTAIGLGASGSGNIGFTAAGVSSTQTGTIAVTPSLSGCTGAAQNFTITVSPTPSVSDPVDQTACGGTAVSVNFNGTPAGASFGWTNTNTAIGLAAAGSGNIAFTTANVTSAQTGTISVTPTLAGCTGAAQNFTVTVNPTPSLSDPADQTVCAGSPVSANFNSTPTGASFAWTNSNTAIGLAASGSGNIAFTAAGVSSSQTGTIAVTPSLTGCSGTAQTFTITVDPATAAGFTSSVVGATATFTNSSSFASSYSWDFGDGGSSTVANPSHTYGADGTYTVVLTSTGTCNTATATQTVTILMPPSAAFTASPTSGCGPLTVQFTNASSASATNFNWQFPGGTPSSSTEQNPTVVYNVPGTYSVTLTASNAAGSNTATQTNLITVSPLPTANFTSTVTGATATFDNTSTSAISYAWDFGDNSGSVEANPSHTYSADGTYTVTLTSTNNCGSSTYTQTVVIITSPNAGFTASTTSGCGPLTIQFTDLSSGNTTAWSWTFEGGTPATSSLQNPEVVFANSGTYDVTLVAYSAGGSSTFSQPNFITVFPDPTAVFTSSVAGTTASFSNGSTDATSYTWVFGDGSTSNEANPSHTYTTDGVYTVTLTASNNCGLSTYTETVTIVTVPSAGFSASATTGCAPASIQFTNASSPNATSFNWTFEGGSPASSTDENPSSTWSQAGTYTVTLIAGNTAGSDTITKTITVTTTPSAGFTVQTAGLGVVLTNTTSGATSYHWNFGDGTTSTEANPTHNYTIPGPYTITLQATNACGTVEISQLIEIVGSAPLAAFSTSLSEGCAPLTVAFFDQSAGNPTSWSWTFPGGNPATSTQQNQTVFYTTPGTYTATLTATNPFGSNSTSQQITVNPLPVAGFTFQTVSGTVIFGNQSVHALTYSWNFGDGSTSTEESPTHTYTASGTYTVELIAVNACGASTLQQTVVVIVSATNTPDWVESFRLFPNPNDGAFSVELRGLPQDEIDFTLFNAIGELVRHEKADFRSGNLLFKFEYGDLPPAVYSLGIRSGDRTFFVKVVVQQ